MQLNQQDHSQEQFKDLLVKSVEEYLSIMNLNLDLWVLKEEAMITIYMIMMMIYREKLSNLSILTKKIAKTFTKKIC